MSVAAARLWAASRFPYLASALFALRPVLRPGLGLVATDDSWRLYVDPDVVAAWPVERTGALLVHHVGHLVRDHAGRARSAGVDSDSAARWVMAADAEVNDDLADAGIVIAGASGLTPEALGLPPRRLAEQYFDDLLPREEPSEEGDDPRPPASSADAPDGGRDREGDGHGSGADGRRRDWEDPGDAAAPLPEAEANLLRARVALDVLDAWRAGRGDVPAGWLRWAEAQVQPHVDWRRVLAAEVRRGVSAVAGAVDYSYRRPSRRGGAAPGVVLPALDKPVPEVAVVCDTSASMTGSALGAVLAEVDGLLRRAGVRTVRVLAIDAAVGWVGRVSTARQVELVGGGGTDMGAGIAAALAGRPRPDVVVVLTDGDTDWPDAPPPARVVVALVGREAADGGWRRGSAPPVPEWARLVRVDA